MSTSRLSEAVMLVIARLLPRSSILIRKKGKIARQFEVASGLPIPMKIVVKVVFRNKKLLLAVSAAVAIGLKVKHVYRMKKLREQWDAAGKDVVVLHTTTRANTIPSVVPFSIKLETFLRMMGIRYVRDTKMPRGPKNKIPWITMNGRDYTDTELIIAKLQDHFNKHPDDSVPAEQRAVGTAMRVMVEEHLYWGGVSWRFLEDNLVGLFEVFDMPFWLKLFFKRMKHSMKSALYAQGLGRHSTEDLHWLMKKDVEALSVYLGDKQFMYGDEPHVIDCAMFGMLAETYYGLPRSYFQRWMKEDFKNLAAYTERMKARFWPDWNTVVRKPYLITA